MSAFCASWAGVNDVLDAPLFEGGATRAMAREMFGIGNPDDPQLALF